MEELTGEKMKSDSLKQRCTNPLLQSRPTSYRSPEEVLNTVERRCEKQVVMLVHRFTVDVGNGPRNTGIYQEQQEKTRLPVTKHGW